MYLIIEETGERIPIPEDSYRLFENIPNIKVAGISDIPQVIHRANNADYKELQSSTIRFERGNLYVNHGYNLLRVLEFIFNKDNKSSELDKHPRLKQTLESEIIVDYYAEIDYENDSRIITIKQYLR